MNKAYKFRIEPNAEQHELFSRTFGCVRFIYNRMLADKIAKYETDKTILNTTPAQYKSEFEWLKEVDSLALANAQIQLQTAYKNFFRDPKVGFPRFRSKKSGKNTYTTNNQCNSIRIENGRIKLPKVGWVRIKQHRQIPEEAKIKSCTISLSPSGKYSVSILTEYDFVVPERTLDTTKALGLDYSSPHFYVDSQGVVADMPHFYREAESNLAREQRKLSRMVRGSNNYRRQKRRVAVMHERVANAREDWLHKRSRELADKWDIICVEDINLRCLAGTLKFGKSTNDNGFGMFRTFLRYKLAEQGKVLIKIDKWFPSSKMCHVCGAVNSELTLADREWTCECGEHHDRDINAAINIRNVGLAQIA